ncbi:MAG: flagellar basal body-associated protein FliL [Pseudomonadaceae bacterium]|nr:flagellar basal body-associated protein FliL [Pseudomonadaceae bacterium]
MAKKEEKTPAAADAEGKPAGKSKLKLIILIVVGLLLVIGLSGGGVWFFLKKNDKKDEAKPEEHAAVEGEAKPGKQVAIYEVLAPAFVVNFNYKGRQRYMQVSVALMGRDKAELDALHEHMPVLRNNLVMLFSGQDFEALSTPVGKEMLRQQTTASVQALAQKETGKLAVEQVLFTNIVLQ